jgi:hypothetical protein
MPANTIFSTLTTPPIRLANGSLDTRPDYRDGVAPGVVTPTGVIFQDNFDAQPDWTNELYSTATQLDSQSGDILPDGWDSSYTGLGFGRPHIEILASNADKTRSGTGKSYVSWKEHNKAFSNQFASNSTLTRRIPGPNGIGVDQLYAEFWIRFDPTWTAEFNLSKLFRVYSSRIGGNIQQFGGGGDSGPVLFFDYEHNSNFGAFNNTAFRGGPWGENYNVSDWRASVPSGNQNFLGTEMLQQVADKENGGLIPIGGINGIATHNMVWGPPATGQWTKIAFFVKMNSAVDAFDGEYMQWRDDLLMFKTAEVNYIRANTQGLTPAEVKWNAIAIGGNDFIGGTYPNPIYPNSAEHEEWYSIDDFVVSNDIPAGLETSV